MNCPRRIESHQSNMIIYRGTVIREIRRNDAIPSSRLFTSYRGLQYGESKSREYIAHSRVTVLYLIGLELHLFTPAIKQQNKNSL